MVAVHGTGTASSFSADAIEAASTAIVRLQLQSSILQRELVIKDCNGRVLAFGEAKS